MIEPGHKRLSIVRQCELASISRASFYRQPASESVQNLTVMRLIDEAFLEMPWYGARQMARHLRRLLAMQCANAGRYPKRQRADAPTRTAPDERGIAADTLSLRLSPD